MPYKYVADFYVNNMRTKEEVFASDSVQAKKLVEKAISEGCDKNIVVLTRERGYVKKHETASKVAELYFHKYPNLARALKNRADNYNACIKRLEELEKAGKALVIAPESTLGVSRTESDPVKLEKLYDLGYKQTMKIIPEIRRYLYE